MTYEIGISWDGSQLKILKFQSKPMAYARSNESEKGEGAPKVCQQSHHGWEGYVLGNFTC